jgi:RNA 2',3'-cyclic 3'-phosphodiesterase
MISDDNQLWFESFLLPPPAPPPLASRGQFQGENRNAFFFALRPDSQAILSAYRFVADVRPRCGLIGRPIGPDRLHVSLHPIRVYEAQPEDALAIARVTAATVTAPPFELTFDQALSYRRNQESKAFVLSASKERHLETLKRLHQQLGSALRASGCPVEKSFTPHMTLLYDRQLVPERRVNPVSWRVNEFVLIHSFVGLSHYEILGSWRLGAS